MSKEGIKIKVGELKLVLFAIAILAVAFTSFQLYDLQQILNNRTSSAPITAEIKTIAIVYNASLITITDATCKDCFEVSKTASQINQFSAELGLNINSEKTYEYDSQEAKELIGKYNITKVPTVIISKEAQNASAFMQSWTNVGSIESDGTLIYRQVLPPYRDLTTEKIVGIVSITLLNDSSCSECYNVSLHKLVLEGRFNAKIGNETYVDINSEEGKKLVSIYNITKVPTVIISSDFSAYRADQFWLQFGSIEKDGAYVFRSMDALAAKYKDLTTNQTVSSALQQQLDQQNQTQTNVTTVPIVEPKNVSDNQSANQTSNLTVNNTK